MNTRMKTKDRFKSRITHFACFVCIGIIVLFCTCCTQVSKTKPVKNHYERNDAWGHVGPGGGGAMFGPAVSPHNPDVAFVTCDMGGSFVTHNGGESWRVFNLSRQVQFFVFDPIDPNVVYANSFGLLKSTDLGDTWSLIYPKPSEIVGIVSKGDHAGEFMVTKDDTRRTVLALAIDPAQSKKMYAAIRVEQSVALYVSENGGEDWEKEKELDGNVKNIFINPSSPPDNRTLYVTFDNGIEQKENGQWMSYLQKEDGLKFNSFASGYDKKLEKYVIYAIAGVNYYTIRNRINTVQSGIFYTEDGGKTWENRQDGLVKHGGANAVSPEYRAIGTSAFHPEVVYVSYAGFKFHPDTTCIGVAKSEDFGKTWTLPWKDIYLKDRQIASPNFGRDWLNERFGPEWGENPFSVAVAPTNPDIFFGSDYGRTIKTGNGGKTWEAVYSKPLPGGGWTTRGMEVTTGYNIFFDPFDETHRSEERRVGKECRSRWSPYH